MTTPPDPSRGELRFRVGVGLAGLALVGVAVASAPDDSVGWIEVAAIAGLFFGGTALHAFLKLRQGGGDR